MIDHREEMPDAGYYCSHHLHTFPLGAVQLLKEYSMAEFGKRLKLSHPYNPQSYNRGTHKSHFLDSR